jgi:hypothetical protein
LKNVCVKNGSDDGMYAIFTQSAKKTFAHRSKQVGLFLQDTALRTREKRIVQIDPEQTIEKELTLIGQLLVFYFLIGAGGETRTRDPNLGKVVLYQLSYTRVAGYSLTP